MKTIEAQVTVTEDGELIVEAPTLTNIQKGRYRAILVLEEVPAPATSTTSKPPLELNAWEWKNWPADATFRREDLYDDDGR